MISLTGLIIWFGVNHGVVHWVLGGVLLTGILVEAYVWVARRRATRHVREPDSRSI